MGHHKQWFGNENIQEMLAGPFFGFDAKGEGRAVEIDHALRKYGQFTVRYFGHYIVCSGPLVGEALNATLTPEEQEAVAGHSYKGDTLADCIAAVFHGEGLELSPGYAERAKPLPPRKPTPF